MSSEIELAECREELAGAVLIGREDRLRATEAERGLKAAEAEAFAARANETRYREALERIAEIDARTGVIGFPITIAREALDTQAREGHGSAD